jgi:hypothetical protein
MDQCRKKYVRTPSRANLWHRECSLLNISGRFTAPKNWPRRNTGEKEEEKNMGPPKNDETNPFCCCEATT